ncbi:RHS repeat-associated core domain-containing protein [Lachnospiraceae bacterium]|nr:RHS repeat-associated core domain-containing protein [Lachnospiraceae bacterium]
MAAEGIHYDEQKIRSYFEECQKRYDDYYNKLETLETSFRNFINDDKHQGEEAESARLFVSKVMIPMINEMVRVIRLLHTKQNKLLAAFDSEVDAASNTIDDEKKLDKIIKDFSSFLSLYKDVFSNIRSVAKSLNDECSLNGRFHYKCPGERGSSTDAGLNQGPFGGMFDSESANQIIMPEESLPEKYFPFVDDVQVAFEKMVDDNGLIGVVPSHKKAFISFDEEHCNDFDDNSEFSALIKMITDNIKRIRDAANGANIELVITNFTHNVELQNAIKEPKDVLDRTQQKQYKKYINQLEKYLKGEADRITVFGSDPVNMTEGNYVAHFEDISLGGNPPLSFLRYYNARSGEISVMGRGWSHSFDQKLTVDNEDADIDAITIKKSDGCEYLYYKYKDGVITQEAHGEPAILKKSGRGWVLVYQDGKKEHFNEEGWFVDCSYISGGKIKISRDSEYPERVSKVTSINGNRLEFSYDKSGRLLSVTDQAGRNVKYEYVDDILTAVCDISGSVCHISYDQNKRLTSIKRDNDSPKIRNVYGDFDRILEQHYADGGSVSFEYDDSKGETLYTEQNGNKVRYIKDDQERHVATVYNNGAEYCAYDDRNNRVSFTDRMGNKTRLTYDESGNLTSVINSLGEKIGIAYDSDGRINSVSEADGSEWKFWHDSQGNITKRIDPEGNKTLYTYSPLGECIKIEYADGSKIEMKYVRGCISQIKYGDGSIKSFEYNELNQRIAEIDPEGGKTTYEYDNKGNLAAVTDPLGNTTRYRYDLNGKVSKIVNPDGTVRTNKYNSLGKLCEFTDEDGNITSIKYNNMFKESERVLPDGGHYYKEYDEYSNLIREVDAINNVKSYTYDALGNRLTEAVSDHIVKSFTYDPIGRIISEKDGCGRERNIEYDNSGNVSAIVDAAGNRTEYKYDRLHHVISVKDANGNCEQITYDQMGRIASKKDAEGRVYEYKYNTRGNLVEVMFGGKTKEKRKYNANGMVTARIFPDGFSYSYSYDKASNLIGIKDSNGREYSFDYDCRGRIIEKRDNNRVTKYSYYANGKLKSVTDPSGNTTLYDRNKAGKITAIRNLSNKSNVTRYEYDLAGRLTSVINSLGACNEYKYDSFGRITSKIDRDGFCTNYEYDLSGKLLSINYSDGRSVIFTLDSVGHVAGFSDWTGDTNITRDTVGNISAIKDPSGQTVRFAYDGSGNRTEMIYPNGKCAKYIYDDRNRLNEIQFEDKSVHYRYDEYDRLSEKILPNGNSTSYDYYEGGNLCSMILSDSKGILDRNEFIYNENGERVEIRRLRRDIPELSGYFHFSYDEMGHLTNFKKDGEILRSYKYDLFGNRVLMEEEGCQTNYSYNEQNQLISYNEKYSDGNEANYKLKYDSRGNLIEINSENDIHKYVYDETGMMVRSSNSSDAVHEYVYNGLGFRVSDITSYPDESRDEEKTEYFSDMTKDCFNLLQRVKNGEKEDYLWDGNVIGIYRDNEKYYYLQDEMGSPAYLTGTDGNVSLAFGFDEFGRKKHEINYNKNKKIQSFSFTGFQSDDVSDLKYANARYYDAKTGRFCSEDLMRGTTMDPESQNLYTYCRNNPITHIDPNGKWTLTAKVGVGFVALAGMSQDIDVSIDGKGNIAIQKSKAITTDDDEFYYGLASAGISAQVMVTEFDTVKDLEGLSSSLGISGGVLGIFGIDFISPSPLTENTNEELKAFQVSVGYGDGFDIHGIQGHTETIEFFPGVVDDDGTICE